MIGIVIVAHGGLAEEYRRAVEHVIGPQEGLRAISVAATCDRAGKEVEICAAVDAVDTGYGVAVVKSFDSYVAQIAEVEDRGGFPHVRRVWCAVDCGLAVNPNVVKAQMEGGIGYGLSAVLYSEITLDEGGTVRQQNWDSYPIMRIPEMPAVEVAIIQSAEPPTGVGEPGTPPIGPAVANAWRRLTGTALRRLPVVPVPVA